VVGETDLVLLFTVMVAITRGAPSASPAAKSSSHAPAPTSTEARIADALLVCMGRWGLAKTTVEDIAREAGVSRATVYRLFPGGKTAISSAAALADMVRLVDTLSDGLAGVTDRDERLSTGLWLAARFFAEHEALTFLREHEPDEFERLVRLERLDALLLATGELVGPVLEPVFDDAAAARDAATWLGRLVASHVINPSPSLDLTDADTARWVVTTFVLPGLAVATSTAHHPIDLRPNDPSTPRSTP
jgi:AcrR family transcriptional regulator